MAEERLSRTALSLIAAAFAHHPRPREMSDSKQLLDHEYAEVMAFDGLDWKAVSADLVERCCDAVFWFSPEAFGYYLPGILSAGLRDNRTDFNAYDSIVGMLDRSPEPENWDAFFAPRWTRLNAPELDAVAAWVRWLEVVEPDAYRANTYERVHETLRLLRNRQAGGPG
jgi:hypothetical protein